MIILDDSLLSNVYDNVVKGRIIKLRTASPSTYCKTDVNNIPEYTIDDGCSATVFLTGEECGPVAYVAGMKLSTPYKSHSIPEHR